MHFGVTTRKHGWALYGSSEVGRCLTVTDGKRDFRPVSWTDLPRTESLTIEDGEIHVRSANAMLGSAETGGDPLRAEPVGSRRAIWLNSSEIAAYSSGGEMMITLAEKG